MPCLAPFACWAVFATTQIAGRQTHQNHGLTQLASFQSLQSNSEAYFLSLAAIAPNTWTETRYDFLE